MSDNIKVVVKVRPLIRREIEDKQSPQWRVNTNALVQIDQNGKESGPVFTFGKFFACKWAGERCAEMVVF